MSSIENVLQSLLSDKSVADALSKHLTSEEAEKTEKTQSNEANEISKDKKSRLEQKIDLINAIIPMLGENAAEKARFLIKLLGIISVIEDMKQSQ